MIGTKKFHISIWLYFFYISYYKAYIISIFKSWSYTKSYWSQKMSDPKLFKIHLYKENPDCVFCKKIEEIILWIESSQPPHSIKTIILIDFTRNLGSFPHKIRTVAPFLCCTIFFLLTLIWRDKKMIIKKYIF